MKRISNMFSRIGLGGTAADAETVGGLPVSALGILPHEGARKPTRSIGTRFNAKSDNKKIAWLMKASPAIAAEATPLAGKITAGKRKMNDKEALCYALEMALKSGREKVPEIVRRLLTAYPAEEVRFPLFGIDLDRARLQDWTRPGGLPDFTALSDPQAKAEIQQLAATFKKGDRQNVHAPAVTVAFADQLMTIQSRVDATKIRGSAEVGIRHYLGSSFGNSRASAGLERVLLRQDQLVNFAASPRSCLATVWNYIQSVPDEKMRERLKTSLAGKLAEIDKEQPCALGMIERIIDTPTAIDFSITQAAPPADITDELQGIAGRINEEFETEYADYLDLVRSEAGQSHMTGDPDAIFAAMKRERFIQVARVEFCVLRGLPEASMFEYANRVFPEGTIL